MVNVNDMHYPVKVNPLYEYKNSGAQLRSNSRSSNHSKVLRVELEKSIHLPAEEDVFEEQELHMNITDEEFFDDEQPLATKQV